MAFIIFLKTNAIFLPLSISEIEHINAMFIYNDVFIMIFFNSMKYEICHMRVVYI